MNRNFSCSDSGCWSIKLFLTLRDKWLVNLTLHARASQPAEGQIIVFLSCISVCLIFPSFDEERFEGKMRSIVSWGYSSQSPPRRLHTDDPGSPCTKETLNLLFGATVCCYNQTPMTARLKPDLSWLAVLEVGKFKVESYIWWQPLIKNSQWKGEEQVSKDALLYNSPQSPYLIWSYERHQAFWLFQ